MIVDLSKNPYIAKRNFLVCIDSDGCAFDTMEIKHKECFCPATIYKWELQAVSSLAREAWEFVNLYSKTRGCSRFHVIIQIRSEEPRLNSSHVTISYAVFCLKKKR